ncbi:MAG: hypothetical protein Q9227_009010 [Pyrenula ochraceoflavens]
MFVPKDRMLKSILRMLNRCEYFFTGLHTTIQQFTKNGRLNIDSSTTHEDNDYQLFQQLGKGQCGTVYALPDTDKVLKIMNPDKKDQLWNDCCMHKRIEEAFQQRPFELHKQQIPIKIPQFGGWIPPVHVAFWQECRGKSLSSEGEVEVQLLPTYGLISSRISPPPLALRSAILKTCAPKKLLRSHTTSDLLSRPENKDCLIRLYLGRRSSSRHQHPSSSTSPFKLQNFDLTLNEMETLNLPTTTYAKTMAQTLAILHWKANVDGNDIEFVLGGPSPLQLPIISPPPSAAVLELLPHGPDDPWYFGLAGKGGSEPARDALLPSHSDSTYAGDEGEKAAMYLLDFNQCTPLNLPRSSNPQQTSSYPSTPPASTETTILQLQRSFFFNDPYYPRPYTTSRFAPDKDKELWNTFKSAYLETSNLITRAGTELPQLFIQAVEKEATRRAEAGKGGGNLFA